MAKTANSSVRLSTEVYELAKEVAELNQRSIAGQIEYWCRLGITLEKNSSQPEIKKLLPSIFEQIPHILKK